jgi:very-short-patch-repair endonuclease
MQPYNKKLKQFARALRSNMTEAEQCLWQKIRSRQLCDAQFYRQKPLLNYIVDFYCPKVKFVIELDGAQHFAAEHHVKDRQRDLNFEQIGIKVLRFDDRHMLMETDVVLRVIYQELKARLKLTANPP